MAAEHMNAAYDFSTFEAQPKRDTKAEVVDIVARQRKKSARKSAASIMLGSIIFFAIFAANVFGYVQLTESTSKISKKTNELEVLKNEYKTLSVQYDSMVDLRSVEQLAIYNYGMSKLDKDRTEYIALNESDSVEHIENKGGFFSSIADGVSSLLNISR